MSGRYAVPQPQAPQSTTEGDQAFLGMNMKQERSELPAGMFAIGNNIRVARGPAQKRRGTVAPAFANAAAFAAILGSGIYSNPNGDEVLLVATPTLVYAIADMSFPTEIAIPNGVTLAGTIEFSQQFDKVLLHAPAINKTFVWNGIAPNVGFVEITKSHPGDLSTLIIPNTAWSINFAGRNIFPIDKDQLGASKLLDYTSYDAALNSYRVNSGSADGIVGAYPYSQGNVLVGKRRSWDVLSGFIGDLSAARMEILSSEIGLVARKSGKMLGADFVFLYDTGVYRINQVIQAQLQAEPVPVSDPIEPLIKRINWTAASGAVAAVHGLYYYLAVPLDGAAVNNAVLVFNTESNQWESFDTWGGAISIDDLWVTAYQGERRVFAVDKTARQIYVLYEGLTDQLADGDHEITSVIETRGYSTLGWNAATNRNHYRAEFAVATLRPSITITEHTDKAGDERTLTATPVTKNPAKYDLFNKADYALDNSNNDFDAPGRQDYSVPDGVFLQGGIPLDQKTESVIRLSTKVRGRWVSYKVTNTRGECDLLGVLTESTGTQRETRRAA